MSRRLPIDRILLTVPFILAVASVILIVYAATYLFQLPSDGMSWSRISGEILTVEPNTPAAEILIPGDIIYSFEYIPAINTVEPYRSKKPGDVVNLTIIRDNQPHLISLQLVEYPLSDRILRISPLLISLAFVVIGASIRAYSPLLLETNLFYLLSLLAGVALAAGSISAVGPPWAFKMFNFIIWWIGPVTVHLHVHFPQDIERRKILTFLPILYTIGFIGSLPFLFLTSSTLLSSSWLTTAFVLGRLFIFLNIIIVVGLLLSAYLFPLQSGTRYKIRFTSFFGLMSFSLFISLTILPGIVSLPPVVPYEIGLLPLILIPLSYGYAIYKHRLINIEVMISRGAAYTLAITILVFILYGASSFMKDLIPKSTRENPLFTILFILILSLIIEPLRKLMQRFVDWIFYGGWYDSHSALLRITEGLEHLNDVSLLGETITQRLKENLRLTHSYSILLSLEGDCFLYPYNRESMKKFDTSIKKDNLLTVRPTGTICHFLSENPDPIDINNLGQILPKNELSEAEERLLQNLRDDFIVPILGKNTLLGLLILGPKHGGEIFSSEDFEIFGIVSKQASIAFQNAQLLAEIRDRASEVDELHKEILRTREEERKRLSRELHDEIIQELVGVNFSLSKLNMGDGNTSASDMRNIIVNLRRICAELRPPTLDNLGLVAAIRSRVREINNEGSNSIDIQMKVSGDEEQWLPEDAALCVYRVFNEAMNNVITHSDADQAEVFVKLRPSEVYLEIRDNGKGFEVPPRLGILLSENHFGLVGIRERLELLKGMLEIQSHPGRGTRLIASVPIKMHEGAHSYGRNHPS